MGCKIMDNKELIKLAIKARENSYSPYSNFKVGAALECEDGSVYLGCNIENSSFTPTCCAERVAVFKAVSEGNKSFKKIAIVSDSDEYTYPCGVCRQVLSEFSHDMTVLVVNKNGEYLEKSLSEIFPNAFSYKDV